MRNLNKLYTVYKRELFGARSRSVTSDFFVFFNFETLNLRAGNFLCNERYLEKRNILMVSYLADTPNINM